jgi:hypothetical protein
MHERLFEYTNGHKSVEWCTVEQMVGEFKGGRFPSVEIRGGADLYVQ